MTVRATTTRLAALDATRGLLIVVMALDHANGLIADGKLEPEMWAFLFPDYEDDAVAFITRFVTHIAAPGFFFLMGAGMALLAVSRTRTGWANSRITRHFLVRGSILIALQFLVENPAWSLGDSLGGLYFGVLYALGASMIGAAVLRLLPTPWLLGAGLAMIVAAEALLPSPVPAGFVDYPLWLLATARAGFEGTTLVLYPILPWLGVTALGMAYGRWVERDGAKALRSSVWLGLAGLAAFVIVRTVGGFGNIRPAGEGWIGFLNAVKYPPAVVFLLLTLGLVLVLVGLLARHLAGTRWLTQTLSVYGRVPLFFYVLHLYLYAVTGQIIGKGSVTIPQMYPLWLAGVAVLYPACLWFGRFKQSRDPDSLWRLL